MPPKPSWTRENSDKVLLSILFMFSVSAAFLLETFHKDDSVIVNWAMGLAIAFMGALINLITGKAREGTNIEAGKVMDMTVNASEKPKVTEPLKPNV